MNTDRLKKLFKNVDASNDYSKYPNTIKKKNSNAIVAQHTPNNTYRELKEPIRIKIIDFGESCVYNNDTVNVLTGWGMRNFRRLVSRVENHVINM